MTCYIVAEGDFHAGLLSRILEASSVQGVSVNNGGERSASISLAATLHGVRREPVGLVLDANTYDERMVREQEQIVDFLLRRSSAPCRVFLGVPTVEVVLFHDLEHLARLLGRPVSEEEVRYARFQPREVLDELLRSGPEPRDRAWLLARIDDDAGRRLAKHPLVESIIGFVRKPAAWAPEWRAA
jgi:hypothetical protein